MNYFSINGLTFDKWIEEDSIWTKGMSCLDRIDIRRMMNAVKKKVRDSFANHITGEGPEISKEEVERDIKDMLDYMKHKRMMNQYLIDMEDSTTGKIYIQPNLIAEVIKLSFKVGGEKEK